MSLSSLIAALSPDLWWPLDDTVGPTATVYDSFDRAAGAIGNAESGQAWVPRNSAVFNNDGSSAYTPSATSLANCTIDHGSADQDITVIIAGTGDNAGICFRYSDDSNYWRLVIDSVNTINPNLYLEKRVAGTLITVGSASVSTATNGATLRVVISGSSITCYHNGTSVITATDSFNSTVAHHGIHIHLNTTLRIAEYENGTVTSTAADASGNGNDGTYHGWPTLNQVGPACHDSPNRAVAFSGSSQYVRRESGLYTGDPTFSMSMWCNPTGGLLDGTAHSVGVLGGQRKFGGGFVDNTFFASVTGPGGLASRTGAASDIVGPGGQLREDCWFLFAMTHVAGSNVTKNYVNGLLLATQTIPTTPNLQDGPIVVGYDNRGAGTFAEPFAYWKGRLAHFALYPSALTKAQIVEQFQAGCHDCGWRIGRAPFPLSQYGLNPW